MFGSEPYDRFGNTYNVSRVLTLHDTFNLTAYEEYSPLYLPAAFTMTYLLAFALSTCVIVHTLLYHGRTLLKGFKRISFEDDDIHLKLMQNYPEVPDWWYGTVFVIFFALAIVAVKVCPIRRPCVIGQVPNYCAIGLEHGYARLGITPCCATADHLCAPIGFHLRNDRSSGALTLFHKSPLVVLICSPFADYAQLACSNHPRDINPWPASRKHDLQSVFGADPHRVYLIRAGPKAWPLHQGPASCDFHRCATFSRLLGSCVLNRVQCNW